MQDSFRDQIVETVLNNYYLITQYERIKLNLEFVDDLYARRLELDRNDKEGYEFSKDITAFIAGLNGTIVIPQTTSEVHHVLIAKKAVNETLTFVGTLVHETTHIHDFFDFSTEFCNGNYEAIEQHDLFGVLYYWTEFHAARNGYLFKRDTFFQLNGINNSIEDQVDHILKTELKMHYENLLKELKKYSQDKTLYIYSVMQFFGVFAAFEDLFPDQINPDEISDNIQIFNFKIFKLYELLRSMTTFDIAKEKFGELEVSLGSLFN
jgi:hypothetical protein